MRFLHYLCILIFIPPHLGKIRVRPLFHIYPQQVFCTAIFVKCGGEILEMAVGFYISGMCKTKIPWQH